LGLINDDSIKKWRELVAIEVTVVSKVIVFPLLSLVKNLMTTLKSFDEQVEHFNSIGKDDAKKVGVND